MIVFCHFLPVGQMESGAQNEMTKFAKQLLLKYTFQYHCSHVSHLMAIVNISILLTLAEEDMRRGGWVGLSRKELNEMFGILIHDQSCAA